MPADHEQTQSSRSGKVTKADLGGKSVSLNMCPRCGQPGMLGLTHACPPPATPHVITQRAPVLCPVCHGKQRVAADFYPIGVGESALAGEFVPCRTCGARGIV